MWISLYKTWWMERRVGLFKTSNCSLYVYGLPKPYRQSLNDLTRALMEVPNFVININHI